jgi:aminoglycoside 6'-N-acetyltransferase I
MHIRPVQARDAAAWAAMRARLWPDASSAELARETSAFLDATPETTLHAAFIAEDDTTPAGFIEISLRPFSDGCSSTPVPHVEGWYVDPWARADGVGRALMAAAETWARAEGFVELASDTEIYNSISMCAHEACGFEEVERLIKYRKPLT